MAPKQRQWEEIAWTKEEDDLLSDLMRQRPSWNAIMKHFPHRTEAGVKSHFSTSDALAELRHEIAAQRKAQRMSENYNLITMVKGNLLKNVGADGTAYITNWVSIALKLNKGTSTVESQWTALRDDHPDILEDDGIIYLGTKKGKHVYSLASATPAVGVSSLSRYPHSETVSDGVTPLSSYQFEGAQHLNNYRPGTPSFAPRPPNFPPPLPQRQSFSRERSPSPGAGHVSRDQLSPPLHAAPLLTQSGFQGEPQQGSHSRLPSSNFKNSTYPPSGRWSPALVPTSPTRPKHSLPLRRPQSLQDFEIDASSRSTRGRGFYPIHPNPYRDTVVPPTTFHQATVQYTYRPPAPSNSRVAAGRYPSQAHTTSSNSSWFDTSPPASSPTRYAEPYSYHSVIPATWIGQDANENALLDPAYSFNNPYDPDQRQ